MSATDASTKPISKPKYHSYPFWCPRFWHGMSLGDWFKLLADNRFRVHPLRIPTAISITFFSGFNSVMSWLQRVVYGRRIATTPIAEPPVFILGHWRSGTTYLHELLVMDERMSYPTTYQCFAPNHFLLSEWWMVHFGGFLIPKRRPMDNMSSGWNRPQEDEFALCNMGAMTPYRRMAFPNEPPPDLDSLSMENVPEQALQRWKDSLLRFVKQVTFRDPKRLVMKSPPHTGRLKVLAEMFPGAKFIHIVRDPFVVFPSTRKLWSSLDHIQGLQKPHNRNLDEYIFSEFERMYEGFDSQRGAFDDSQLCEIRYEDLVRDPLGQLESIYEQLALGDFQPMRERLERHLGERKSYQTNQYDLDEEARVQIRSRWAGFMSRYGY